MKPLRTLTSHAVLLPIDHVDTDQIIPASYLKGTTREGLGEGLFAHWRYDADGAPRPDFALNRAGSEGAAILVAGDNFGCGSSREHAAWALLERGFRAILAPRFADIFRSNAAKNGLLAAALDPADHRRLVERLEAATDLRLTIDVEAETLSWGDGGSTIGVEPFARHCLLHGVDALGYLLDRLPEIEAYEARHPSPLDTSIEVDG